MTVQQGRELAPQQRLMQEIKNRQQAIEEVATKYLSAEKLLKFVGLAISKTPKLAECTVPSVLKCVMTASQLGLDPSGNLGSAYLVPYGRECTLIIGYRGLVDLLRRHVDAQVEARLVYKDDKFQVTYGTTPAIVHEPNFSGDRSDAAIVAAYVVFTWPDGRKGFEVMAKSEIDKVKNASRSGNNGPWVSWYGEMAKKTVVRRGIKLQPLTVEAQEVMRNVDEDADLDIVADVQASEVSARDRIAARVSKQRESDGVIVDEAPGPDGDAETRAIESARPPIEGKRTGDVAAAKPAGARRNTRSPESLMHGEPAAAKPAGKVPNNETFADDDLAALENARDIERE